MFLKRIELTQYSQSAVIAVYVIIFGIGLILLGKFKELSIDMVMLGEWW